jgi:hypothetical protein
MVIIALFSETVIIIHDVLLALIRVKLSILIFLSNLSSLLDLFLPLSLDGQYLPFGILLKHVNHEIVELNGIMKELLAVGALLIENECSLGNPAEVMVEDILLQDQCVLPVSLVI